MHYRGQDGEGKSIPRPSLLFAAIGGGMPLICPVLYVEGPTPWDSCSSLGMG